MGGSARLCYHGVPAILTASARPPQLLLDPSALLASRFWAAGASPGEEEQEQEQGDNACSEAEAALLARYLATSRINFNLRQVWPSAGE